MGSFSIWHWLIVLLIVVLIFGTKKLRNMGGDVGGAVKNFKEAMGEESSVPVTVNDSNIIEAEVVSSVKATPKKRIATTKPAVASKAAAKPKAIVKAKAPAKAVVKAPAKAPAKPKAPAKAPAKTKAPAKPKAVTKPKVASPSKV